MMRDSGPTNPKGQHGLVRAALYGLCPRCGAPTLFEAPARVAIRCPDCDLDFTELERGARLSGLLTILIAAVLVVLAISFDIALGPPLWLQMAIWAPVTVGTVIGGLRLFKTALLYSQFDARHGQEDAPE